MIVDFAFDQSVTLGKTFKKLNSIWQIFEKIMGIEKNFFFLILKHFGILMEFFVKLLKIWNIDGIFC